LSARLAGVLKDAGTATPPDDDTEPHAADATREGPAATTEGRQAADPLWFLRQPAGTAPQDGTPAQAPEGEAAAVQDSEIRLSRPQDLRPSLPPLFGAEEQPPVARMSVAESEPSPAQSAAPGNTPAPAQDNIHTAKTQPLMPAPDVAGESPDGGGAPQLGPAAAMQAVAQAAAALAETSAESPKLGVQPQPQAASMATPTPPAEPAGIKSTSAGAGPQARTLEQVIGELLEPVIRQWLEANLPRLVEELVRKEVARAIAVERPTSVV